ncbi:uncharacterized protein LOC142234032 isoform X2 [Haematobia irritans]
MLDGNIERANRREIRRLKQDIEFLKFMLCILNGIPYELANGRSMQESNGHNINRTHQQRATPSNERTHSNNSASHTNQQPLNRHQQINRSMQSITRRNSASNTSERRQDRHSVGVGARRQRMRRNDHLRYRSRELGNRQQ